jgi:hypothetical protein
MKNEKLFIGSFVIILQCVAATGQLSNSLPPGVPNPIGTDGKWTHDGMMFTTHAYQIEALRLLLQEANEVARQLKLPEKIPITKEDVRESYVAPFGIAYVDGGIGCVDTANYSYCVSMADRFCYLTKKHLEVTLSAYQENYMWPKKRINTAEAYQMATQWLTAAQMDVKAMNRDLHLVIKPDDDYIAAPRGKFVPVYDVGWCKPWKPTPGIIEEDHSKWEPVVSVQLFTPTKTLLQMHVEDAKYILRPPIVFTNLAELLKRTNAPSGTNASAPP